ncbi:MAG TPA: hypothetical protein VMW08_17495 [Acidimicrobiales bacterium]|nr:hypothetical protein [Acidimicrobiales bacterium]
MKATSSHPFLILAAACSAAAGMIHAGAAGSHSELTTLAMLYALVGMLQVTWAVAAIMRGGRGLIAAGMALQTVALGAWIVSRISGISFISGLEDKLTIGFQDGLVAGLEFVAIVGCLVALGVKVTGKVWKPLAGTLGALALIAAVPAAAAEHDHGTHAHDETATTHSDDHADDAGHDDGTGHGDEAALNDHGMTEAEHEAMLATVSERVGKTSEELGYPSQFAMWFDDPTLTDEQIAAAEKLLVDTNEAMKAFPDEQSVKDAGYVSIGDSITGWEHYINVGFIAAPETLDPNAIESIVLKVNPDGTKQVASAMYLMTGGTMADAPEIAGDLTLWHDHQNLCWVGVQVVGTTDRTGKCEAGTFRATAPMIHVWLIEHPCGPFAGIEGSHGEGCSHGHDGHDADGEAEPQAAAGTAPDVPEGHDNSDGHHDD